MCSAELHVGDGSLMPRIPHMFHHVDSNCSKHVVCFTFQSAQTRKMVSSKPCNGTGGHFEACSPLYYAYMA
jgi:hypothetical protein